MLNIISKNKNYWFCFSLVYLYIDALNYLLYYELQPLLNLIIIIKHNNIFFYAIIIIILQILAILLLVILKSI